MVLQKVAEQAYCETAGIWKSLKAWTGGVAVHIEYRYESLHYLAN